MYMIDTVGETSQELDGIQTLPMKVAGIKKKTKLLAAVESVQSSLGTVKVEGDLAGMDFQSEFDASIPAGVKNGIPVFGEFLETSVNQGGFSGGIAVNE